MDGYWWGVLTPFAIILGILLLYLTGNLFGAIVSWAWKKAHYGLLKKGWIAEDYDEDSREWTTPPRRGTPGGRVDPVRRIPDAPVLRLDDPHHPRLQGRET